MRFCETKPKIVRTSYRLVFSSLLDSPVLKPCNDGRLADNFPVASKNIPVPGRREFGGKHLNLRACEP